jgi:hypothetical protein
MRQVLTRADPRFGALLDDPAVAESLATDDAEIARVREAIERGADPLSLGFTEGTLEQVMRERGLL